ncbi:MAG: addiction module protein [Planctomycetota bacterium]
MDRSRETLIEEALQLPEEARAALAGILLESLEDPMYPGAEAAWAEEIDRRLARLDPGASKLIPWTLARRQILGDG